MKLFWKYYAFLFLLIVLNNGFLLLNKNSPLAIYYNTLLAFNHWYITAYLFNILNIILNTFVTVIIFNYAFNAQAPRKAPTWLFYARLFSEFTGHSFEWQLIQTGFAQGIFWGSLGLTVMLLPLVPSYLLQWRITFNKG